MLFAAGVADALLSDSVGVVGVIVGPAVESRNNQLPSGERMNRSRDSGSFASQEMLNCPGRRFASGVQQSGVRQA